VTLSPEERLSLLLDDYLASINHYLPIYHSERLRSRLLDDPGGLASTCPLTIACANGMAACVGQRRSTPGSSAIFTAGSDVAGKAIRDALSVLDITVFNRTSLFTIQVLLTVVLGLQRLQPGCEMARNLLAVASRMALSLSMHRSNEVDTSFDDRMEMLRVFCKSSGHNTLHRDTTWFLSKT